PRAHRDLHSFPTRRSSDLAITNPDNSLRLRLKYAFATYTPQGSPLTYKAGLIHTPWLDWEEALWDYRVQGTMAMDRAGHMSASRSEEHTSELQSPDHLVCR